MNDINCIGFKSSWCHYNTDMYTISFKNSISITSTLYQKYIYLTSSLFQMLVGFFPILNFHLKPVFPASHQPIYIKVNLVTLN